MDAKKHMLASPKIVISDQSSDQMQIISEGALYYQTSSNRSGFYS